jgi:D-beta-D-heptose 7-phosphate kinase/D-beta-D-heptose 1-phosphate adenosyltransferase
VQSLLQRVAGRRVLVVGDIILDEYVDGEASRISPEAPVPVLRFGGRRSVLGGAANTAANVASLGGRATLAGLVGDDAAGGEVERLCREAGIELVPLLDGRSTTRKVRVVSRQQQLLRIDYEDVHPLREPGAGSLRQALPALVSKSDVVVVSDYAKGVLAAETLAAIRAAATRAGRPVVVDPRPAHGALYAEVDYLTPNWKEALGLLGEVDTDAAPNDERITAVGLRLRERCSASVLLTLGSRGMALFPRDGGHPVRVEAEAREVFDVSGAGDTVVAAFALALAAGASPEDAVRFATRAAAVVVGKWGTATVSAAELAMLQ